MAQLFTCWTMRNPSHWTSLTAGLVTILVTQLPAQSSEWFSPPNPNPISRIARLFDSQLVEVEDRISWLDGRLTSFAIHNEYPLKTGLGYRGCRLNPKDPDPSVVLDLGREMQIDEIYLIPSQPEFPNSLGIFPRRFTLELSNRRDFGQRIIYYTSGANQFQDPGTLPAPFTGDSAGNSSTGRYVRLTVHEGSRLQDLTDIFGLSEIVVFSNDQPVSFGATVNAVGQFNSPGLWYASALTDGRTPLGVWEHGPKTESELGDSVAVYSEDESTSWTIQLPQAAPLDRVILFPYQPHGTIETSVLPEALTIQIGGSDGVVHEWTNPLPGADNTTPLVIPLNGQTADTITVTATRPGLSGNRKINALSEIEVWSRGENLAMDLPVERLYQGISTTVKSLTNGYTSQRRIAPFLIWLRQLHERGNIEEELEKLRPMRQNLAANSELNATWGSAVLLGLTFLIPVFIVERRRLMSKEQLDQIRKRIASDLHDDIGSNLGSISLIARTARKDLVRLEGPTEIAEDLDEVETIARESSLAMRDIVWLLERRQDSIGDLVQRMRETANRLLREIHHTVDCQSNKTAAKLTLDAKRHLFLFYKEAIHNILKHSQAQNVSIRLWDEDDRLALEIADDGIGIPSTPEDRPASVNKLQDRAHVLEGQLQIESAKGIGTRVFLLVKRSHLTSRPTLS